MFPNAVMMKQETWNDILRVMIAVRDAHGWREEAQPVVEAAAPSATAQVGKPAKPSVGKAARPAARRPVRKAAKKPTRKPKAKQAGAKATGRTKLRKAKVVRKAPSKAKTPLRRKAPKRKK
jgi:hypothetical protein